MKPLSLPGPVRQIGYVVGDLDAAIDSWVAIGVGPWYVIREIPQRTIYRGTPCEVVLSVALANSGEMQIELIAQHGGTPSIYTEFLERRGEGFHQLAWWVDDFPAALAAVEAAGLPVVWRSREDDPLRYAYVEPAGGPAAIIEIMELNDATRGMVALVHGAAQDWDGSHPVRSLM